MFLRFSQNGSKQSTLDCGVSKADPLLDHCHRPSRALGLRPMAETIVVCGYGVGISDAVARQFAKHGYRVAIVARSAERLRAAAEGLKKEGFDAHAFPADLSDPEGVKKLMADVRASLGPI